MFPASTPITEVKQRRASKKKAKRALPPPLFDPGGTDVHFFHPSPGIFRVFVEGGFRKVRKIAKSIHGEVRLYRMHLGGRAELVAVKEMENRLVEQTRTSESNDRTALYAGCGPCEDALTEIGVLQYLNHQPDMSPFLIKLRGIFRNATHTMVVTEHCDEGDIFGLVQVKKFSELEVKMFMGQLFHAVSYLHRHNIAHRDISLENIPIKNGKLRLMDFGQAVQIHKPQTPEDHFRYFRPCGKLYYRAPECYVPRGSWQAPCPLGYTSGTVVMGQCNGWFTEMVFHPGFVAGHMSSCEALGFKAAPVDIFACGVVLFSLHGRLLPWNCALPCDRYFRFAFEKGIASLLLFLNKALLSDHGMELLEFLVRPLPTTRPSIQQCLDHPWFEDQ